MTRAVRRAAYFEQAVRADVAQRRWLHIHALFFGTLCFLCSWGLAAGLMYSGVERLSIRWPLALGVTYLVYLVLLRLWCGWLLSSDEGDGFVDGIDALLPGPGSGSPADAPSDAVAQAWSSGGGGDFGGGGASASFGASEVGGAGSEIAQGVVEAAGSADEGIVVVVP